MGHGNQRPEIEHDWAFMSVLVTSNFDEDSIKNEWASMQTPFSHYKAASSVVSGRIWPKFKLVRDFMHVLVACKYKKDRIKNNREKVETPFSPFYLNGGFLFPWKPEFWSSLPQNVMQPSPHPNDATHKIWSRLANWLQRHSSSKVWNFVTQGQVSPKMSGRIRPKIELIKAFMLIQVISNFDDDSIKNEWASIETAFSHYKSMGNVLDAQGQLSPKSVVLSGRNLNSFKILCMSSLPASIKKIGSKATEKRWRHHFPHYKSMGNFCCHGHQSFDPICLKTLCSLSRPWPSSCQSVTYCYQRDTRTQKSSKIDPTSNFTSDQAVTSQLPTVTKEI